MGWLGGYQVPLVPDVSAVGTTINVEPAGQSLLFPEAIVKEKKKTLLAVVVQLVHVTTQHTIAWRGTVMVTSTSGHPASLWPFLVASDQPGSYSSLAEAIPLSDGVVCQALTRGKASQETSAHWASSCKQVFLLARLALWVCEPTVIPPQRLGSCPDQPILTDSP